jgi:hypothetical protein
VEGKTEREKERNPWCVEKRQDALARDELTHLVDIAERNMRIAARHGRLLLDDPVKDGMRKHFVELQTGPHEKLGTNEFQKAITHQQRHRDPGQHEQRRLVPAREHPVIDLQHVEWANEHQKVRAEAEYHGCRESGPVLLVGAFERIRLLHSG